MSVWTAYILSALVGYLCGSFPTAYLLVKWTSKIDIRRSGSGNVGTLNTMQVTGSTLLGVGVMVIDMAKGALPVLIMLLVAGGPFPLLATAGLSAIIGHGFPVWTEFKGGRGLATTTGVMLILGWIFIVIWIAMWIIAFLPRRDVLGGNIVASVLSPLVVAVMPNPVLTRFLPRYTSPADLLAFSVAFCLVIILTHGQVIRQFLKRKP